MSNREQGYPTSIAISLETAPPKLAPESWPQDAPPLPHPELLGPDGMGSPSEEDLRQAFGVDRLAPDALREALARRIEGCRGLQLYEAAGTNRGYTTDTLSEEQRAEIVAALRLSAPVPSPDGALFIITQNDMDRLHGASHGGAMLGGDKAYEGCLKVESILAEIASRSPSATGAAEPVAWTIPGDDQADCNGFIPTKVYREGEFTKPLYAHPPVREERESLTDIRNSFVEICRSTDMRSGSNDPYANRLANEAIKRIDAILSLPVQPGAVELESIADWCSTERAKIGAVDGYDYRSGEEFGLRRAEIEITKRVTRQPQQSSGEKL